MSRRRGVPQLRGNRPWMSDPILNSRPDAAGNPWCWIRLWVYLDLAVGAYGGVILWIVLTFNDGWASAAAWVERPDVVSAPSSVPPVEGAFETLVWPALTLLVVAWLGGVVLTGFAAWRSLTLSSDPRVVSHAASPSS